MAEAICAFGKKLRTEELIFFPIHKGRIVALEFDNNRNQNQDPELLRFFDRTKDIFSSSKNHKEVY